MTGENNEPRIQKPPTCNGKDGNQEHRTIKRSLDTDFTEVMTDNTVPLDPLPSTYSETQNFICRSNTQTRKVANTSPAERSPGPNLKSGQHVTHLPIPEKRQKLCDLIDLCDSEEDDNNRNQAEPYKEESTKVGYFCENMVMPCLVKNMRRKKIRCKTKTFKQFCITLNLEHQLQLQTFHTSKHKILLLCKVLTPFPRTRRFA